MELEGATVVITHHIRDGKQQHYEEWLNEIGPICRKAPGNIDWQIIRPIKNLTYVYTIIIRFDSIEHLKAWMESQDRKRLIEKIKPLITKDDNYYINSGLDFLFAPPMPSTPPPVKWKQYLVTWSAIYPLSLFIPLIVLPLLRLLKIPAIRFIDSLFISGTIVLLMVYLVMPHYTRLLKKWLYK